jgi:hypothetical protein
MALPGARIKFSSILLENAGWVYQSKEGHRMAEERTTAEMLETLAAQARLLWGEADAERQRPALSQTAEEIAIVARTPVPADLEPKFFA